MIWERSAGQPLTPLPESFKRTPSMASKKIEYGHYPTYSPLQAFYLPDEHEKHLADGFQPRYPGHIMVDHNVSAVDWDHFLINIRVSGALRTHEHIVSNLAPAPLMLMHAGCGCFFLTKAIMGKYKSTMHQTF